MKRFVADKMVRALEPYRQYLLINEWDNIKAVIMHWVDEQQPTEIRAPTPKNKEETPPLKGMWEWLWDKKISAPVGIYVLIVIISFVAGHYIW